MEIPTRRDALERPTGWEPEIVRLLPALSLGGAIALLEQPLGEGNEGHPAPVLLSGDPMDGGAW